MKMKNITPKQARSLARPDQSDYEIGYAKPPQHTRFEKGRSGNPKGRPRGRKNKIPGIREERLKGIILEEAYRDIKVNDGDKQVKIPMVQAIVRTMAMNAAKGNTRSQRMLTQMLMHIETQNHESYREYLKTFIEYKADWEKELEYRKRMGLTGNLPVPHPDDIYIDFNENTVDIRGPFTKEAWAQWKRCGEVAIEVRVDHERALAKFQQANDPAKRPDLLKQVDLYAGIRAKSRRFEDWYFKHYPDEAQKDLDLYHQQWRSADEKGEEET